MNTLEWEHGAAPKLRAAIISRLHTLVGVGLSASTRSLSLLLAVRFRRAADALVDANIPREYTYAVDVALPTAEPAIIGDMLNSRRPNEAVRYDLVRVRLSLPGGVHAALNPPDGHKDKVPMLIELVTATGEPVFGKDPASVAKLMGTIDAVRKMTARDYMGTSEEVQTALESGIYRQTMWVVRQKNLFNTIELPMAILAAFDTDHSPCAVVARLHRVRALSGATPEMIDYEAQNELATYPNPTGLTVSVILRPKVKPREQGGISLINRLTLDDASAGQRRARLGVPDPNTPPSAKISFALADLRVVVPTWTPDLEIPLVPSDVLSMMIVRDQTAPKDALILGGAAKVVSDLMRLRPPATDTSKLDFSLLLLVRYYPTLERYLPKQVLDEFVTRVVGEWSYELMTGGYKDGSLWRDFSTTLLTQVGSKKTRTVERISSNASSRPEELRVVKQPYNHPVGQSSDYLKLTQAVAIHLARWYCRFYDWTSA